MRKTIEFQPSTNNTAILLRGKPNAYEDLVLVEAYRKYHHRFEAGKTKIRLLPAMAKDSNWLLEIPTLQHLNGRHVHPRAIKAGAQSAYDLAFEYLKRSHPTKLFNRSNKSGIRLLPAPLALCWAIVEDANGIRLRLILQSFYDGSRGGANGLGNTICEQVFQAGENCNQPGHPLNPEDGVSLCVERIGGSDTKFPAYRVSLADDRGPLLPLLAKISELEHNSLCPVKETLHIMAPEEEWRLLARFIGDALVAEIRSAQLPENTGEDTAGGPHLADPSAPEESPEVEETEVVADDYKDFPS